MWQRFIWWFKGTTTYNDLFYKRFEYKGSDDRFNKILAQQEPNRFFRIGWYILFTNESKKCAWIYCNQKSEANHG